MAETTILDASTADSQYQEMKWADSWQTQFSNYGKYQDKSHQILPFGGRTLTDYDLSLIWARNGMGKKVVSSVSSDMVRAGFSINGDADSSLYKQYKKLKGPETFKKALDWQRLYGGSVILLGLNDGRQLNKPADPKAKLVYMKVYGRPKIKLNHTNMDMDPASPYFEDFELFPIQMADGMVRDVHASRLLLFKGIPAPEESYESCGTVKWDEKYWGLSTITNIYNQLAWLGTSEQGASALMQESSLSILKVKGLAQLLNTKNRQLIMDRFEVINLSKSIMNSIVLDTEEDFIRNNLQYNGVSEILNLQMLMLSAVSEIPITRLYGRSPSGLNATGVSDLQNYYDMIQGKQESELRTPLQTVLGYLSGNTKNEFTIDFNPVWTPSAEELITMRKTQMETDMGYLSIGVPPEKIIEARFSGGYDINNMNFGNSFTPTPRHKTTMEKAGAKQDATPADPTKTRTRAPKKSATV